jgi:hypothetical protein
MINMDERKEGRQKKIEEEEEKKHENELKEI